VSREELRSKLESGLALTAIEQALLEAYLEEDAQSDHVQQVKGMVPCEPSLAWRAHLNAKLEQMRPAPKRWFSHLGVKLAAGGLATAAAGIALFLTFANGPQPEPNSISQDLVRWHQEAVAAGGDQNAKPTDSDKVLFGESVSSL